MLFSSMTFIFLFLPSVFLLYHLNSNISYRNFILAVASLLFYAFGEPRYIFLMIFTVLVNYWLTRMVDKKNKEKKNQAAKCFFVLTIFIDLALLGYFKYANFFVDNINSIFGANLGVARVILPIGISFYTFQVMSYVIDVYRQKCEAQNSFLNLLLYISLFPQLIAGPIVTYVTIEKELKHRTNTVENMANGFRRFVIGLGKKVIIANNMAIIIDHYLGFEINTLSTPIAWIGILAYTLQIYFDFSGYSDMAIGLGKMFGFTFLENFNYPYIAKSVTEFWRRWHISLSTWFRDYVYIPLGGNRVGKLRWFLNIFIVWFLTGFWHGASWSFVAWGLWYAIFLVIEKQFLLKYLQRLPGCISWMYTFFVAMFGWVFFRLETFTQIKEYFMTLFGMGNYGTYAISVEQIGQLYPYVFFIPAIIGITPLFKKIYEKALKGFATTIVLDLYLCFVFGISITLLLMNTYNPFIYFRF